MEHVLMRMANMPGRVTFPIGAKAGLRGAAYLLKRPRFLALCLAPFALNLLITLPLTLWLIFRFVYEPLTGTLPEDGNWWVTALGSVASLLLFVVLIAGAFLVFLIMAIILSAPFHDKLSEWVERDRFARAPELLPPDTPIMAGIRHSVREAVKRVALALPAMILVVLLGVIPLIGPVFALALNVILAAQFLTLDAMSYSMDRRGIPMGAKLRFLRANPRFAIGFGLPFLAIPCALLLVPPISAVAGTLVFCDLLLETSKNGELEDRA